MEQSTSSSSLSTLFNGEEVEIAEILLNLPNLILKPKSPYRFSVIWTSKRRRSAINSSPCQSQSVQVERENDDRRPRIKAEAASPATPLSFSPSESDGKSKDSVKKVSKKRTREEWIGIVDGLLQQRELLRGEIEAVKSHFNKLQAVNWELKAKRKELQFYLGNPHLEKGLNQIHRMDRRQLFIWDQTAYKPSSHTSQNLQYPHGQMPQMKFKSIGSVCIPDLNVAAEEAFGVDSPQPMDHFRALTESRAKAAEARRRRMVRIKEMKKKPLSNY